MSRSGLPGTGGWGLRKAGPGASLRKGELFLMPLFPATASQRLPALQPTRTAALPRQLASSEDGRSSGQ